MSIFKRVLLNAGTSAEAEEQWGEQKITDLANLGTQTNKKAICQDDPTISPGHIIKIQVWEM